MAFLVVLIAMIAYLLGNINGAVVVSKFLAKEDVRKKGSGNAGLTNYIRNYGAGSSVLVIAIDVLKAVVACWFGGWLLGIYGYHDEGLALGALGVILGHDFPMLLGFKGGKGILCGFTVALVLDWRIALFILAVFVIVFAVTRYVSLGSVLASAGFAVGFAVLHYDNVYILVGGVFLGLLALWMHRSNILRLVKGQETKTHLIHRDLNKQ